MSQDSSFDVPNPASPDRTHGLGWFHVLRQVGRRRVLQLGMAAVATLLADRLASRALAQSPVAVLTPMPMPYDFIPSPNFGERPAGTVVSCVVMHSTVEPTTEGTVRIFQDDLRPDANRVSAHFVVGRDGRVVQMVPVEKRAWHAGGSSLEGVRNVNNYSVGIELVNLNDGKDPYPEEQVRAVAGIIRFLRSRYTIPDSRIVSHALVASNVGRSDKTDPAGFDFNKLYQMAREGTVDAGASATPAS